jgi:uncharacterized coiled-coil DUF342 family protein
MMTKQQEREALERIRNILADAGADSYIGMAFAGCVEDAESNIENDWALSMAGRWQSAEQKLEAVKAEADGLRAEREALRAELDKYSVDVEKLRKSAEALNSRRSEEHAALERAQSRADAAEAEIIRLKAKLYDFMTAAKD